MFFNLNNKEYKIYQKLLSRIPRIITEEEWQQLNKLNKKVLTYLIKQFKLKEDI